MDKVITAKDLADREGYLSVRERIDKLATRFNRKLVLDRVAGNPVYARIDFGRWIADCECGGAEYVDPDEPLFFCLSCGNLSTSGRAREVIFPDNRPEIEKAVMNRKVKPGAGDKIEQQFNAVPIGQPRSWSRGEKL